MTLVLALTLLLSAGRTFAAVPCESALQDPFNTRSIAEELINVDSKYLSPSSNGLHGYFLMPMLYKKDSLWKPGVLDKIREEHKSFQEIIELLPTLKAMGKNMLWLTPVHPQTTLRWINPYNDPEDRDEYNNHFYWVSDHRTVSDMLGGEAKFKELIETARELGIEICLDTVLDHFGYGETFKIGTPGKPDKAIELWDQRYFRPIYNVTRNKQVPSSIYDAMANETDSTRLRQKQEELTRFSLANLASFNHSNPEIRAYLIEAYKHFVDLGVRVFRLDAVKHIPQDFIYEFINTMNEYAATKRAKLTFILEFLEYRDSTLDLFVKDLIAKVSDNERVYFLDFPLARELRRLQDPRFGLDQMMGFIRWRENKKHPLMRYIPMVEDHDMASPINDPFVDRIVYMLAEFFSYNPVILHHGQESDNATRIAAREPIESVDASGPVNELVNDMSEVMEPYRKSVLMNQTVEHVIEPDFLMIEKVRSPKKSVFFMAHRKNQYLLKTINIPERLQGRKVTVRVVGSGLQKPKFTVETKGNQLIVESDRQFYAAFEITEEKPALK